MKENESGQTRKHRHRRIREAMIALREESLHRNRHDSTIIFAHNGHQKQEDARKALPLILCQEGDTHGLNGHRKAPPFNHDLLRRSPAGKAAWELKKKRKPVRLHGSPAVATEQETERG